MLYDIELPTSSFDEKPQTVAGRDADRESNTDETSRAQFEASLHRAMRDAYDMRVVFADHGNPAPRWIPLAELREELDHQRLRLGGAPAAMPT